MVVVLGGSAACAHVEGAVEDAPPAAASAPEPAPEPVPPTPLDAPPVGKGDSTWWRNAVEADGDRLVVSREIKRLWLMVDDTALFTAPVAVGRDTIFHWDGTAYDFSTPAGLHRVQGKEESPDWVPPDWHYFEKASEDGLEPVHLKNGDEILLSDSTVIAVRDYEVGRINHYGNWWAFRPGNEIIFDGKIFIPPFGSPQRRIPEILGTHRLILGDGYLIHGTPEEDSIGEEASHGCVRMFNRDVAYLYDVVPEGTPVYIY
jgi:hypothetical protein